MDRVLQRRDTAANWSSANPVLAEGELGIITDTKGYKIGDGSTAWNDLEYPANPTQIVEALRSSSSVVISQKKVTEELNTKANKIISQSIEGASVIQELQPNTYYVFGECTSLTITLAEAVSGILNEYLFKFISGTIATILSMPESVKWYGENLIEANKTYIVSIIDNIAVLRGA